MKHLVLFALLSSALLATGCALTSNTEENAPEANTNAIPEANLDEGDFLETDFDFETDYEYTDEDIVTEDVYGKDLDLAQRYPGSVRSYYESYEGEIYVTYQTTDGQEAVRSHFDELLLADGWELIGESTDSMEYVRENDDSEEYMSIYFYELGDLGVLEYELLYENLLDEPEDF